MGKIILIASGKGGTGKTMFTANIGALLAMEGKKVLLVDMDLGLRNLDLYLGLEDKVVYNVMDVLSGICSISKAIVQDKRFENLYFMAASPYIDDRDITQLHMKVLYQRLKNKFDYIIIDAPAGASDNLDILSIEVDRALVITEAENASIRDADVVEKRLRDHGIDDIRCIINKVNVELMTMGVVPSLDEIMSKLNMLVIGFMQWDENIHIATNRGVPIVLKDDTYIEKNFRKILNRILEDEQII